MEIQNIKANVVKGLNDIGTKTTSAAKQAVSFVQEQSDRFIKKDAIKNNGINKNTVIGAGVVAAVLVLATKCLKTVTGKIAEVKNKD